MFFHKLEFSVILVHIIFFDTVEKILSPLECDDAFKYLKTRN